MSSTRATAHVPHLGRTVFAHRGLPSQAPENTIASFARAADCGATWIETDVDITRDGTPIIIHDTTLDRTTNRSGGFYSRTADDLVGTDAGAWYGKDFAGEGIPTLSQLVEFLNARHVNANIEIKQNEEGAERTLELIRAVSAALEGLDEEREVIISSFSQPLLLKFHEHAPELAIGVLYETVALYDDWRSVLELCGATHIHPEDRGLTRDRVRMFRDAGYGVNVWTVNSSARANELFNWGCTGVFTDIADQLLHV